MTRARTLSSMAIPLALAFFALVPHSALAVDQEVVLCKSSASLCPEKEIYPALTLFEAQAQNVIFSSPPVKCKGSTVHGSLVESMGNPLQVSIDKETFSACNVCASVSSLGLPYTGSISMDAGGAYLLSTPARISFISCPSFNCTFGTKNAVLEVVNTEGGAPELIAQEEELVLEEGSVLLCGSSTTMSAVYIMNKPAGAYFSLFELE